MTDNEKLADRMDEDSIRRGPATSHQLVPVDDENVSKKARVARNVLHICGEKAGDEREIQQRKDLQLNSWVKETDILPDNSIRSPVGLDE